MLFRHLPDEIFQALSGSNRALIEAVLNDLAEVFYDHAEDPIKDKSTIIESIEDTLHKLDTLAWHDEQKESFDSPKTIHDYALRIYHRLVNTGWLVEEQELYRVSVLMTPQISMLLRSLVEISRHGKRNYGATVLSILSNLESVAKHPKERGVTLRQSAEASRDFSAHLNQILLGIRSLQRELFASRDPKAIVAGFFDLFVEGILIADYKTIKTSNNPFRFRRQILELTQEFLGNPETMGQVAQCYVDQQLITMAEAQAMVEKDCRDIIQTFSNIEQRLERIDEYRYRLEKRAADTARYMDSSRPGMANKVAGIITDIAKYEKLPILKEVIDARFVGMSSAAQPTRRREPPPPRVMTPSEVSADAIKMRDQQRRFHEARQVTIPKMQSYLDKQIAAGNSKHILDFTIESVEDFVCFDHLRYVGSLGVSAKKIEDLFEVQFTNQYVDVHDFVECREFTVVRRSKA
ncbi:Wadjet anti-phage system protein JetA family protein [Marinomonas shanghaiensis]|uniref:Wadjet anti-phage system protein JetA family protein n=1 Tax=Marinomonas shanghaiensis TaxID=2202418 RepID=UPI000DBA75DA|nr:Wadjet anti-phage system protein JetA family protein [Marinomonas shanghaiensis]